jgi:hypothetical protein
MSFQVKNLKKEYLKHFKNASKPKNINNENSNVLHLSAIRSLPLNGFSSGVNTKISYLGVVRADPNVYARRYGDSLVESDKLPDCVRQIPTPPGLELVSILNSRFVIYGMERKYCNF